MCKNLFYILILTILFPITSYANHFIIGQPIIPLKEYKTPINFTINMNSNYSQRNIIYLPCTEILPDPTSFTVDQLRAHTKNELKIGDYIRYEWFGQSSFDGRQYWSLSTNLVFENSAGEEIKSPVQDIDGNYFAGREHQGGHVISSDSDSPEAYQQPLKKTHFIITEDLHKISVVTPRVRCDQLQTIDLEGNTKFIPGSKYSPATNNGRFTFLTPVKADLSIPDVQSNIELNPDTDTNLRFYRVFIDEKYTRPIDNPYLFSIEMKVNGIVKRTSNLSSFVVFNTENPSYPINEFWVNINVQGIVIPEDAEITFELGAIDEFEEATYENNIFTIGNKNLNLHHLSIGQVHEYETDSAVEVVKDKKLDFLVHIKEKNTNPDSEPYQINVEIRDAATDDLIVNKVVSSVGLFKNKETLIYIPHIFSQEGNFNYYAEVKTIDLIESSVADNVKAFSVNSIVTSDINILRLTATGCVNNVNPTPINCYERPSVLFENDIFNSENFLNKLLPVKEGGLSFSDTITTFQGEADNTPFILRLPGPTVIESGLTNGLSKDLGVLRDLIGRQGSDYGVLSVDDNYFNYHKLNQLVDGEIIGMGSPGARAIILKDSISTDIALLHEFVHAFGELEHEEGENSTVNGWDQINNVPITKYPNIMLSTIDQITPMSWIDDDDYSFVKKRLTNENVATNNRSRLYISGTTFRNSNHISNLSVAPLPSGNVSVSDPNGEYFITSYDAQNNIISQLGFTPSFHYAFLLATGESKILDLNLSPIGYSIESTGLENRIVITQNNEVITEIKLNNIPEIDIETNLGEKTASAEQIFSFEELLQASKAKDVDEDNISFIVSEVTEGALLLNGIQASAGSIINNNTEVKWINTENTTGQLNIFKINAFDGISRSETSSTVSLTILQNNPIVDNLIERLRTIMQSDIQGPAKVQKKNYLNRLAEHIINSKDTNREKYLRLHAEKTLNRWTSKITPERKRHVKKKKKHVKRPKKNVKKNKKHLKRPKKNVKKKKKHVKRSKKNVKKKKKYVKKPKKNVKNKKKHVKRSKKNVKKKKKHVKRSKKDVKKKKKYVKKPKKNVKKKKHVKRYKKNVKKKKKYVKKSKKNMKKKNARKKIKKILNKIGERKELKRIKKIVKYNIL